MKKILNLLLRMEMNSWIKETEENFDYIYNNKKWFIENSYSSKIHSYLDYVEEKKENISIVIGKKINHFSDLKKNKNIGNDKLKKIIEELYLSTAAYRKILKTN